MATYPIKMLKDEQNIPFVPLVSTEGIQDPEGLTLEQRLSTKLGPTNLHGGTNISVRTEGYDCYIDLDLPSSLTIIDNLTTSTSGQGALDAHQGYVLKNMIPSVIDDITSTSATNALSANQGYLLNSKFNNYYPLSGGNLKGDMTIAKDADIPYLTLKDTVNSYNITPTTSVFPGVIWTDKDNNAMGRVELIEDKNGTRCMSLYAIKPGTITGGAFFKVGWNTSGEAFSSVDGNLTIGGSITVGSGFGKKYTFTKTVTISTDWQDVGIARTDLPTGAYIVYIKGIYNGSQTWQQSNIYTGLLAWFDSNTNSSERYEIPLHTGGHAHNDISISLATLSHSGNTTNTTLQIKSNTNFSIANNISFTFVKVI